MSVKIPYSDSSQYDTGGLYAPTSGNFPAAKLFFQCNEAAATNTLTDVIQGSVITYAGLTKPDAYSVVSSTTTAQTTSGTAIAIDSPFVYFVVAKGAFPTHRLGITTGTYFNVSTTNPAILDGQSSAEARGTNFTLNTASTIYGRANVLSAFDSATGQTTYEFTTTTTASALADTATDATSFGTVALANPMTNLQFGASGFQQGTGTATYGILFMKFTAIPSNLKAGLAWMTYQWSVGNKWIYPGWKGVS